MPHRKTRFGRINREEPWDLTDEKRRKQAERREEHNIHWLKWGNEGEFVSKSELQQQKKQIRTQIRVSLLTPFKNTIPVFERKEAFIQSFVKKYSDPELIVTNNRSELLSVLKDDIEDLGVGTLYIKYQKDHDTYAPFFNDSQYWGLSLEKIHEIKNTLIERKQEMDEDRERLYEIFEQIEKSGWKG